MSKVRAAVYVRVSTEEQTNNFSLRAQEAVVKEYAERKGYEVTEVYCDDGYSGKNFNRPEVQRLFRDLNEDKVDVILVWKVDRLSRSNNDVLTLIDKQLAPNNKKLIITSIDIDSTSSVGYMFISLLGTFASYERAVIIDRVNSGMEKRATEGLWNGGIILGYDNVDKHLILNEKESKIVKEIFLLREQGLGYKSIVNKLNERGEVTKKGKPFSIPGIKLILENPVYIGKIRWGKYKQWESKRRKGKANPTYVDGIHTPIITQNLWNKVQQVNKLQGEAYSNNRNFKGELFLTGILKCPKCGAGTVMSKTRKKNSEDYYFYYMCQAHHSKGKSICNANLIKKDVVEQRVLNIISEVVRNDEIMDSIVKKLDFDKQKSIELLVKETNIYQSKLNAVLDKQLKLDNDYFESKIEVPLYNRLSSRLQVEIEDFQEKIKKQKREIKKLSNNTTIDKEAVLAALVNFNEIFYKADDEEKKVLVRTLIKEIKMEENRKEIKEMTFWFFSERVLPSNKEWRTISQIIVSGMQEVHSITGCCKGFILEPQLTEVILMLAAKYNGNKKCLDNCSKHFLF
ncbi:recombinase family protein [Domibacillus sp. PGB-M46]|uniref:recombinase family protein n=1 Tax=Domibacillus sp. PGB-M46 TaxID=2910255 RepID=UPI001F5643EA|nr:recombinase family protein [Domibacillus sp. PGB-M46]MCI2253595.1 recombinase family protein [Domibacillus sp. PGB-M46]